MLHKRRLKNLKFYDIIIDVSTNILVIDHLMVFATYFKEDMSWCVFLGLLHINDSRKYIQVIFTILRRSMKEWDIDIDKHIIFNYNGVIIIIENRIWLAACFKEKINYFL